MIIKLFRQNGTSFQVPSLPRTRKHTHIPNPRACMRHLLYTTALWSSWPSSTSSRPAALCLAASKLTFNPRPCPMFCHLRQWTLGATPWGFQTKRRRASRKGQHISFAEYLQMVVLFLALGQNLTQLRQAKGQIFRKSHMIVLVSRVHTCTTIYRSGMKPSPACSPINYAWNEMFSCNWVEYLGRIVPGVDS